MWRAELTADLMGDESWLTLAGLTWLQPGENAIGAGDDCAVKLPAERGVRGRVGVLMLKNGEVSFQPATEKITQPLKPEETKIHSGPVVWKIIVRGERIGVRFYDLASKNRKEFPGQKWFPINENYKIKAKFTPFNPPRQVPITNVLGDVSMQPAAGTVEFTISGKVCHLTALQQGEGLFFNFRDLSSGKETYPAGRFLNTEGPVNGYVTLDFNKAMNPPCAFTAYATCPLPPKENVWAVKVTAGELVFHHH
jgi:uncharacterized protein (DUF1684 family)